MVFCSLSLRKPGRVKQQVTSRNLRRINPTRFQTDISQVASSLAECPDCELLEEPACSACNSNCRGTPVRSVDHRGSEGSQVQSAHKQLFIEQRHVEKSQVILSAKRKHFCEKLSKCNSSKQLYGLTNELLGNSKSSVFPSDIPESELPDHLSSFFVEKKSHLFALILTHNLLLILTYQILLLAVSFVALSKYRRSLFANVFAIPPPIVVYLIPFRPLCWKSI